ncbi:MAG TPA: helix-turn-helix domain-containing protein [Bryobacteraceae bacterium]|jgi:AraC family transcriptional regulator|nr:helix-turn-helix domain-containing protein [Bryobacteraceae bacterium]
MKPSTTQDYRERMVRTLVYIQGHLDDDLELDTLAGVAAFSRFHFHRIFRGLVGETVKQHIRRLRLERAARSLKQSSEPITRTALEAGFDAHESFTRAFTDMFGVSPSAYRAAHKPAPESVSNTHLDDVSSYHPPGYGDLPPVAVKELPPTRIVFLRHVGHYAEVGATSGRLMS